MLTVDIQLPEIDELKQLVEIGQERGFLLISHDLPLVLYACQRLLVMQAGRIIDGFPTRELFAPQRHPWTQKLCINAGLEPTCS